MNSEYENIILLGHIYINNLLYFIILKNLNLYKYLEFSSIICIFLIYIKFKNWDLCKY